MYFDENNNYYDVLANEEKYDIDQYNTTKNSINNFDINIDSINFDRTSKLYSTEEGFNKGNMFENLYSKYKNHVYKLKVNNAKDELLYKIQMYTFAMKDLNLYLDLHPEDKEMLSEYQKLRKMNEELKSKYEREYGPLCASAVTSTTNFNWISNPWPWDKGGNL